MAALAKDLTNSGGLLEAAFADQAAASRAVDLLTQGNALVTHMGPERRSLEEVFINAVKGEQ